MKDCENCKKNKINEKERDVCKECVDRVLENAKEK